MFEALHSEGSSEGSHLTVPALDVQLDYVGGGRGEAQQVGQGDGGDGAAQRLVTSRHLGGEDGRLAAGVGGGVIVLAQTFTLYTLVWGARDLGTRKSLHVTLLF